MNCAFDHHDGIVDDDADGEHDREQGRKIDGETEGRHGCEGADDGDRHGRAGYQHGAPILQEDEDDKEHEDRRFDQGLVHLMDGLAHEGGSVEGNVGDQAGREFARELGHLLAHLGCDLQRVRSRCLEHGEPGGGLSI